MKTAFRCTIALGACSIALALGCSTEKSMADGKGDQKVVAVNKTCPMSGKPIDSSVTENVHGKAVGFCCTNCEGKFDKMTDADKDAKIMAATAK